MSMKPAPAIRSSVTVVSAQLRKSPAAVTVPLAHTSLSAAAFGCVDWFPYSSLTGSDSAEANSKAAPARAEQSPSAGAR